MGNNYEILVRMLDGGQLGDSGQSTTDAEDQLRSAFIGYLQYGEAWQPEFECFMPKGHGNELACQVNGNRMLEV